MAKLLVIDDKAEEFRKALDVALEGHEILYASDAEAGLALIEKDAEISCVLLDIAMPPKLGKVAEEEGLAALRGIRKLRPGLPVLMLTASGEAGDMVRAIRMGAYHYLIKPPDGPTLRTMVSAALANSELREKVSALEAAIRVRDEIEAAPGGGIAFGSLVGTSEPMRRVFALVEKVAPRDVTVLLLGETGTGKELVAREIHARGVRARRPFVPVNCANLSGTLLESELFGHRKGAFTDAKADRQGAFRAADGGTIFLDEIAEMSAELQSKLLRVLQERAVKALGADAEEPVDVRVIAATNQDIDRLVREERFREDLFYRLNVVRIVVPPLRQRREDIRPLAEHFLAKHAPHAGFFLSDAAARTLAERPWPGNVRELENAVQGAVALADRPELTPDDFQWEQQAASGSAGFYDALWHAARNGRTPQDINRFAELYGKLALADVMRRASEEVRTDREAGRLLGFIPEDDPGDKAFNNYRAWKRRVSQLKEDAEETPL